ncbi:MAG: hypothetical protein AAFV53_35920 [Myxococcota bacterium]
MKRHTLLVIASLVMSLLIVVVIAVIANAAWHEEQRASLQRGLRSDDRDARRRALWQLDESTAPALHADILRVARQESDNIFEALDALRLVCAVDHQGCPPGVLRFLSETLAGCDDFYAGVHGNCELAVDALDASKTWESCAILLDVYLSRSPYMAGHAAIAARLRRAPVCVAVAHAARDRAPDLMNALLARRKLSAPAAEIAATVHLGEIDLSRHLAPRYAAYTRRPEVVAQLGSPDESAQREALSRLDRSTAAFYQEDVLRIAQLGNANQRRAIHTLRLACAPEVARCTPETLAFFRETLAGCPVFRGPGEGVCVSALFALRFMDKPEACALMLDAYLARPPDSAAAAALADGLVESRICADVAAEQQPRAPERIGALIRQTPSWVR